MIKSIWTEMCRLFSAAIFAILIVAAFLSFTYAAETAAAVGDSVSAGATFIAPPSMIASGAVEIIDNAGGNIIGREAAVVILGIIIIAIYRTLQWAAGKMKTPVGTLGMNAVAMLVELLFGSEASWRNRVISKDAGLHSEKKARASAIARMRKEYPLIWAEFNKAIMRRN